MASARSIRAVLAVTAALLAVFAPAAASAAPPNDEIAAAQEIAPELPATVFSTTVGATGEPGETIYSAGNPVDASVWFKWTPTANTTAVVSLCGTDFSATTGTRAIGVYTGAGGTFASRTEVAAIAGECHLSFEALAATTYKIQVAFVKGEGDFRLDLRAYQPPANDNFAGAQNLGNALPTSVAGSTVDSGWQSGDPAFLGTETGARSVWYSWTAPSSGQVQIQVCPFEILPGSASNLALAAYTGASLGSLVNVAQTTSCSLEFNAVSGTVYRIAFSGTERGEGTFTLALRAAAPPANDDLADATTVGPALPLLVSGDTTFSTTEAGEEALEISGVSGSAFAHSVWYQWTPAVSEKVKISVCDGQGRPRLGVYTGGATIGSLAVATEPQDESPYCVATLDVAATTTYKIVVATDDRNGSEGAFELDIHRFSPPPNDNILAAIAIGPDLPIVVMGSNADAGTEAGEVRPTTSLQPISTVWYRWDSRFSGPVEISTCGSGASVLAAAHVGQTFATMSTVSPTPAAPLSPCAAGGERGGRASFVAAAGATYWIQVASGMNGLEGPFRLTISDPNPAAPPPLPGPPAAAPDTPQRRSAKPHRTAKRRPNPVKQCRQRFKGKSRKARVKRARCIAKAKRRAAIAKCRKIGNRSQRKKCVARAKKPRRQRHGRA